MNEEMMNNSVPYFFPLRRSTTHCISIQAESMCSLNYLPVGNGVIVSSHFWVNVVQVPLEILTL